MTELVSNIGCGTSKRRVKLWFWTTTLFGKSIPRTNQQLLGGFEDPLSS